MSEDTPITEAPKAGTKAALELELEALRAKLAEAEAKLEEAPAPVEEGAQGEPITFSSKKRADVIRFPFRPQQTLVRQTPAGMTTHIVRHPRAVAKFVPHGAIGLFTTTDLEEQRFLSELCDPLSKKRNRNLSIVKV